MAELGDGHHLLVYTAHAVTNSLFQASGGLLGLLRRPRQHARTIPKLPIACPSRANVLASGTFSSPMRVNVRYTKLARTSPSSVS